MTRTYTPKGAVLKLLAAMKAEPDREFSSHEAAQIMGCHIFSVTSRIEAALRAKLMYRRSFGRGKPAILRGTPFPPGSGRAECQGWKEGREKAADTSWATDPDDIRIGKVDPNWKPPVMRHVRGGA